MFGRDQISAQLAGSAGAANGIGGLLTSLRKQVAGPGRQDAVSGAAGAPAISKVLPKVPGAPMPGAAPAPNNGRQAPPTAAVAQAAGAGAMPFKAPPPAASSPAPAPPQPAAAPAAPAPAAPAGVKGKGGGPTFFNSAAEMTAATAGGEKPVYAMTPAERQAKFNVKPGGAGPRLGGSNADFARVGQEPGPAGPPRPAPSEPATTAPPPAAGGGFESTPYMTERFIRPGATPGGVEQLPNGGTITMPEGGLTQAQYDVLSGLSAGTEVAAGNEAIVEELIAQGVYAPPGGAAGQQSMAGAPGASDMLIFDQQQKAAAANGIPPEIIAAVDRLRRQPSNPAQAGGDPRSVSAVYRTPPGRVSGGPAGPVMPAGPLPAGPWLSLGQRGGLRLRG